MNRFLIGLLAAVAISICLYTLFHQPTEKAEQLATDVSEALGQRAALEVAQLLGHKGRIGIIGLEINPGQAPTYVAAMDKFTSTIKKNGVTIARSRNLPGGLNALMIGPALSAADYSALVDPAPKLDAVVTFVGPPQMPADELQQFLTARPPLVVVDIFGVLKGPLLPSLAEEKSIALAFAPRNSAEVDEAKNEPKIFERYYKIFRPSAAKP